MMPPHPSTETIINQCNICGNDLLERLGDVEGTAYAPGRFFGLYRCGKCQLVFIHPQPEPDELRALYPEDYGPHDPGNLPGNAARKALMDTFREFVFLPDGTGHGRYRGLKSLLARLYNTFAYRSIPAFIENGVLLDVGSGLGTYLFLLQKLGWRVHGIEANKNAALFAQRNLGLDVREGGFEDAVFPENSFDVITMWHSLEHFPDPGRILRKVNTLMKSGGRLLIGAPNYASMDRKLFGRHWNGAEIPLHLFHFNPVSLQTALESAGFQCKRMVHTIRPPDFAKSLRNLLRAYFGADESRLIRNLTLSASIPPTFLFALLKRSSIIVIQAVKASPASLNRPSAAWSISGGSDKQ